MPDMDQVALAEIQSYEKAEDYGNPRYMELLTKHYYIYHILRMPHEEWPDPVNRGFKNLNTAIYIPMQGPSELGTSGMAETWDRTAELDKITVPTLVIGAKYDTMDPKHMEWMSTTVQHGRYLYCPNGSHMALYDEQEIYFRGLVQFILDVNAGRF
jgi:proline iminopeptidase